MKTLFLTISDRVFFPGTLAAINSLLENYSGVDFEIAVVSSGQYNVPLSTSQMECLESHEKVKVYSHEEFAGNNRILGAWQLKAYAAADLTAHTDFEMLVGFDSDLFFTSDVYPTQVIAHSHGKMMGGQDGDILHYGEEYSVYGFAAPTESSKYMSTSCYFIPLTGRFQQIIEKWAQCTDTAMYGPQPEKVYPGHGDQGVLNAVIHADNAHELVDTLPNRLWSQHWTFEDDVLEWDSNRGSLVNYSLPHSHQVKAPAMRTVHCGGSDKFWSPEHSVKRRTTGMSQRWAYAKWLQHLFLSDQIAPWGNDPAHVIAPQSGHLYADLVFYHQLIAEMMGPKFDEAWSKLPLAWFSRCTESSDLYRMMTLSEAGSMKVYADLVAGLPTGSEIVEVGSYLGGSITTAAIVNAHKRHRYTSVESFLGNRDNTVDGRELPSLTTYIENVKRKFPFLNINSVQLPSRMAAKHFPNGSLDMVFLDGGHSQEAVEEDIRLWHDKVKTGGIIAGDDYGWEGVSAAVQELYKNTHQHRNSVWWVSKE